MEQPVYKIGEVSARLGLVDKNSNTLRSWADEFAEFLSQSCNPPPGQSRRFTSHDVRVLTAVRSYRANHLSYDEIRDRLRAGEHTVEPVSEDQSSDHDRDGGFGASGQGLLPIAQLEAMMAPFAASANEWRRLAEEYRGRLEAREARIEALERRLDELSVRVDGTAGRGHPRGSSGADSALSQGAAINSVDPQAPPPDGDHSTGNGAGPSLFPLPVAYREARSEPELAPVQVDRTRRPWWRPWG